MGQGSVWTPCPAFPEDFQHFIVTDLWFSSLLRPQRIYTLIQTSLQLFHCIATVWGRKAWEMGGGPRGHMETPCGLKNNLSWIHNTTSKWHSAQSALHEPFEANVAFYARKVGFIYGAVCFLTVFISEGCVSLMPVSPRLCDWEIMWFPMFVLRPLLLKWDIKPA